MPTSPAARPTSASPAWTITASSRGSTRAAFCPARGWIPTSTARMTRVTSCCGRLAATASRAGPARSARAAPAGTWSARPWRWRTSARRSTSTPGAWTCSSRTTRTRSRSRRAPPAGRSRAFGCTPSTCSWTARRWRSRWATSTPCAISSSGAFPRTRSATCWSPRRIASSSISRSTGWTGQRPRSSGCATSSGGWQTLPSERTMRKPARRAPRRPRSFARRWTTTSTRRVR